MKQQIFYKDLRYPLFSKWKYVRARYNPRRAQKNKKLILF